MPNVNSLEYQRTLQKQEKAVELVDIWAAILDAGEAIKALGGSYPDEHIRKAQDALLRAGKLATGDLTDDVIKEIATVGTARIWAANMGQVFAGETIIDGTSGETCICTVTHQAQALYAPGTEGGRTLFRLIREEPEEPGTYLDFAWGEHVPYGAVRRDPIDGKLYTPIKEAGVTLYEPHYPHLVPSEYKLYEDGGEEPEPGPEPEPEPAMAEVISLARMTAQALPDAQALQVSSLYPLWAAGTSYGGKGEAVIVRRPNGYLYRCREPHTAQAGWEPETTAALWAAIQGSQAGTPEDPIPAARGMEYQYGLYYLDPEDSQIYPCRRTGEEEGGKVVLQYLPHELVGQYFEVVE